MLTFNIDEVGDDFLKAYLLAVREEIDRLQGEAERVTTELVKRRGVNQMTLDVD